MEEILNMLKNIDLENEKREDLCQQMVEDLIEIARLEQRPIKHFKADKNGVFCVVGIDSINHITFKK
jgi:hypothetical protein